MSPRIKPLLLAVFLLLVSAAPLAAQEDAVDENPLGVNLVRAVEQAGGPENISTALLIFFLLTILTLAPAILVMTTSFTRIIVVFGFLRQAMGMMMLPPVFVSLPFIIILFVVADGWLLLIGSMVRSFV